MKRRIKILFAWYDIWVGVFVDTKKKMIYVFPVPCIGLVIKYGNLCRHEFDLAFTDYQDRCKCYVCKNCNKKIYKDL